MKRSKWFMAIGIFCVLALFAGASAWAEKDHLIVGIEDDIKSLDFYQTTARSALNSAYMIWDPIVDRDPKTNEMIPHLAESWKSIDQNTWEFKLRDGVKFHNGNPLTAECVRYTLEERVLNPEVKSPMAGKWKWVKKIEVVDKLTFRIITENPYPLILEQLYALFPFDPQWTKEMLAKNGDKYFATHAMGTGPYKVVSYSEGDKLELARNENYWKKGYPKFKKMTYRIIPEISTRVAELISGGIDAAEKIQPDQIATVEKSDKARIIKTPILRYAFWIFDGDGRAGEKSKPITDVRVRKAIWHAIDRKMIVEKVLGGNATYVNIPINPMAFGADPSIPGLEYDPEKAKALLKEAGYEKGFTLGLWHSVDLVKRASQAACGYLEKVGIQCEERDYVGRYGQLQKLLIAGKCDGVWNLDWGFYNVFDADGLYSYFFMTPEGPFVFNTDEELNKWLHEARETIDKAKRKELYRKSQQRIMDKAFIVPFFAEQVINGANKKFNYEVGADEVARYQYGSWKD
jgi:peptide/nickel transport system substrate-binding protein